METTQPKREEILKILQMIEEGKIDQDKALSMIAVLEGKEMVGGPGGVVGKTSGKGSKWMKVAAGLAILAVLIGLLYVLLIYLPTHVPIAVLIIVYSFLGIPIIGGVVVGVVAITRTMSVGRTLFENKPAPKTHPSS